METLQAGALGGSPNSEENFGGTGLLRRTLIETMAQVIAQYDMYDWATLPERGSTGFRDRGAFREIAGAQLDAIQAIQGNP